MTWDPVRRPIDHVLLAGKRSPGICEVVDANSPRRWEERKGYGRGGAHVVYRGIGLSRPKLVIRLYSDADWDDWHAWAPLVYRPPIDLPARRAAQTPRAIGAGIAGIGGSAQRSGSAGGGIAGGGVVATAGPTQSARARAPTPFGERPRALEIWHPILEDLSIRAVVVEDVSQPEQTGHGEWTIKISLIEYRPPMLALARPEGAQARPQVTDPYDREIEGLTNQLQALTAELDAA